MDKSLTYEEDLTPHLIQGKVLITPHSLNHNPAARNIFRLFDNCLLSTSPLPCDRQKFVLPPSLY